MAFQFDTETQLTEQSPGEWSLTLSDQWNIGDNPNGGYLLAPLLRGLSTLSPHSDPLSVTAHYLRPGSGNASALVHGSLVRSGRNISTLRGSLEQAEKTRVEVLAAFGTLGAGSDQAPQVSIPAPEIPGPDQCRSRSGLEQGVELLIQNRVEIRIHPDQVKAGGPEKAEISGWIRFLDGRQPDPLGLVLFADVFPPPIFGLLGRIGWVPTIELTVHIRRLPAPGWVQAEFVTEDLHDGRMIESGRLWDSTGALVAQSRQLAMLLTPEG
ncbi:MAG: thioesterase family protein [Actinobacteria bacterium]|nr:thioesterase family protein [Actinomycetota bacterium]MBT3746312.1 thioesterase family protein [Actinomycetota bacterium]MBT3969254.1 thioesterase family protein [Actinomycetota bacterium]MBT4010638.1 thioesterase family protein [Actinomycetota bacterium]MBT4302330.1 thioesterase family protein [Actinomycetota bacterium]